MVHSIKFFALGLATLAAAQQQFICQVAESDDNNSTATHAFLGIIYSETDFKGVNKTIEYQFKDQCINLEDPIRSGKNNHNVRSIKVNRDNHDECIVYQHDDCVGSQRSYHDDKDRVKPHRGISSIRCKHHHKGE